jgi:hypothetical protein
MKKEEPGNGIEKIFFYPEIFLENRIVQGIICGDLIIFDGDLR